MRRALVVVLVAVGASLVVPAAPAAAETRVDPNGNVVTITIAVDIVGAKGKTSPDGTMSLVDYWEKILNETWGAAFRNLPYKNCYRLELKLKLTAQGRDFDSTKGRHRILVAAPTGGLTFEGTGFDGVRETSRNHRTGDGTGSMENDRDGAVPVDAPPRVVSHEFGHLFGLGQDFVDKGRPIDTVMVGGEAPNIDLTIPGRIDQNLVNRLGEIIEQYLKDQNKKLPKCQTWTGPLRSTGTSGDGGVTHTCVLEESGTVTLAVDDNDKVTGTLELSGSYTCTDTGTGITGTVPTSLRYPLSGTLDDRTFRLKPNGPDSSGGASPGACVISPILEIPVERGTGSGEQTQSGPYVHNTCTITVERQTDDEPVG